MNAIIKQLVNTRLPIGQSLIRSSGSLSISGMKKSSEQGLYCLTAQYRQLAVAPDLWLKMWPDERMKVVKQFEGCSVYTSKSTSRKKLTFSSGTPDSSSSVLSESHYRQEHDKDKVLSQQQQHEERPKEQPQQQERRELSISAEECGIDSLPHVTLRIMWQKAEDLLNSENMITNAPGSDTKARMVMSQSSAMPHFVTTHSDGQYLCDTSCGSLQKSVPIRLLLLRIQDSYVSFCSGIVVHSPVPTLQHLVCKECPVIVGKSYPIDNGNEKERRRVIQMTLFLVLLWQQLHYLPIGKLIRVENVSMSLYMYPPMSLLQGQWLAILTPN